jgi:competence protein ComEA
MKIVERLESSLGLTRGDVTVALFLGGAAVFGLLWVTLVGEPEGRRERMELLRMQQLHDSLVASRDSAAEAAIDSSLFDRDSVADLAPITAAEAAFDSALDVDETKRRPGAGGKRPPSRPVNINTATRAELMRLPGIGEKTAEAVMAFRASEPFRTPDDLMKVKGIGPKKFERMKAFITVR